MIIMQMASAPSRASRPVEARYDILPSTLGFVAVAETALGIAAVLIDDDAAKLDRLILDRLPAATRGAVGYGSAIVNALETGEDVDLPLDPQGTPFQKSVWRSPREIGLGETITYSELAARVGRPASVRAVAAACGANPIAVIVPCHRVIGKDGKLTGYAWGIEKKRMLLDRERRRVAV